MLGEIESIQDVCTHAESGQLGQLKYSNYNIFCKPGATWFSGLDDNPPIRKDGDYLNFPAGFYVTPGYMGLNVEYAEKSK